MKTLLRMLSRIALAAVLASCAGQVPPSGGPEDFIPPQIISVYPAPYTKFYRDNKIVLEFDEYVDRNSLRESIFISPPVGELEFDWSGKEVEIGFNARLRENTTYVVNVGTDVKDLRRGNRMAQAFALAFSTGPNIDRGAVAGRVHPLIRGEQVTGVMLFAYKLDGVDRDTLNPRTSEPDYVTQSGKDGMFFFRHLSLGPYRILALRDQYRNFLYDPETDEFGVFQSDLQLTESDTLVSGLAVRLAKEDTTAPRLVKIRAVDDRLIVAEFSESIDTAGIRPGNFEIIDTVSATSLSVVASGVLLPERKGVMIGTERQEVGKGYSLRVLNVRDSIGLSISPFADRLVFEGSGIPDTVAPRVAGLTFRDSTRNVSIEPVVGVFLSEPVQTVAWSAIVQFEDSVSQEVRAVGRWAGDAALEIRPVQSLRGKEWYKITINGGVLTDAAGNRAKDTVWAYRFETIDTDRFGRIDGTVADEAESDTGSGIVIRAYNLTQKITHMKMIPQPGPFSFERLVEGQYTLEAFRDRTRNGSYDAGKVFPFRPSEHFTVYPDTIRVRARWPVEGVKIGLR